MDKETRIAILLGLAVGIVAAATESSMKNVQAKRRRYNRQVKTLRADKLLDGPMDDVPIDDTVIRTCLCPNEDHALGMTKQRASHQWWVNKICNGIIQRFPGLENRITSDSLVKTDNGIRAYRAPDISIYDQGFSNFYETDDCSDLRFAIEVVHSRPNFRYSKTSIEEVALDNPTLSEAFIYDFSKNAKEKWSRYDPNTGKWTNTSKSSFLRMDMEDLVSKKSSYATDVDDYIKSVADKKDGK